MNETGFTSYAEGNTPYVTGFFCFFLSSITHFNTLTANYEYSRSNRENLPLPIQMQLSEKVKTFSHSFIAFLESTLNFEHFEKEMSLIAQVFLKLLTPKDVLT